MLDTLLVEPASIVPATGQGISTIDIGFGFAAYIQDIGQGNLKGKVGIEPKLLFLPYYVGRIFSTFPVSFYGDIFQRSFSKLPVETLFYGEVVLVLEDYSKSSSANLHTLIFFLTFP